MLKYALRPYLPHRLLYRRKLDFRCPIDRYLRAEIKDFAYDTLLGSSFTKRGLFEPDYVWALLDEPCAGARQHNNHSALLVLKQWYRMWIDPPAASLMLAAEATPKPVPAAGA